MLEFTRLRKNLKKDFSGLKASRVAILADSSSQLLHVAIRGLGYERGCDYQIYEADYNQIEQEVFNPQSRLFYFLPEVIIISNTTQKLLQKFYSTPAEERSSFAQNTTQHISHIIETISNDASAKIILLNFQETDDKVFGNYANNLSQSFLYQVKKLNLLLMEQAQVRKGLFICDVQQLTLQNGFKTAFDYKNYITSDQVWSFDFLPPLAKNITDIIEAQKGLIKKCIVLDLDNTVWGGVIGDDGLEGIAIGSLGIGKAFTLFQKWIKELKNRGIIIAVCSKNTEAVAREVFEKHPEMILRPEDIAVFAVNWDNKVDNIYHIKTTLNIGFDSMVFFDDSPFERSMVKEAIPDLYVPDLPEDPAEFVPYLQSLNLFETTAYTQEDEQRTQIYKEQEQRASNQKVYQNEDEFLKSLQMEAEVIMLDKFTIPRAAQLSQRSNQFNLRTIRYTENQLEQLANSPSYISFTVRLKDKFGDNGIICFIILKKEASTLFIDTWLMSCRVLKRGVEHFVLNEIVTIAGKNNIATIAGEYIPTVKNELVKEHFANLGFQQKGAQWFLPVAGYKAKTFFITNTSVQVQPV